jgi:hypothetical protein
MTKITAGLTAAWSQQSDDEVVIVTMPGRAHPEFLLLLADGQEPLHLGTISVSELTEVYCNCIAFRSVHPF